MKAMSSPLLGSGKPIGIAGMTEDEFLSYVAIIRAKRHLVLSSQQNNEWNSARLPAAFSAA